MTIQDKAREAYSYFETATRNDSTTYVRTTTDAPEWVRDLAMTAHGDMFPDDWRYSTIEDALGQIADMDDPDDGHGEFADSCVDVYTARRFAWLASHLDRQGYVDEAVSEFSMCADDFSIAEVVGLGQYMEAREVYSLVLSELESLIEVDN